MTLKLRKLTILLLIITTITFAGTKDEIQTNWRGLAIAGVDPVAYFTQSKVVDGSSDYELKWKDAKWRFSTKENKELFEKNPTKYAPQYGGYCAFAVANGYTASIDPDAWSIVDDKLYLNYSLGVREKWKEDIPGNIKKANVNWPKVLER